MGTSTAHPSPRTAEWDYVREAYRDGVRDPAEVARRIANALSPQTRAEMCGAGPAVCLDTLLAAPPSIAAGEHGRASDLAGSLGIAAGLRSQAERRLALGRHASLFSDIALDALGICALSAHGGRLASSGGVTQADDATREPLNLLADLFLSTDVERCFQYFVSRDIAQFIGCGAFPTVLSGRSLADSVAEHCRKATVGLLHADNERDLRAATGLPAEDRRLAAIRDILSAGINSGLTAIAAPRAAGRATRSLRRDGQVCAADDEDVGTRPVLLRLVSEDELEPGVEYLPVYSLQAAAGYFGAGEGVEGLGFLPAPLGVRVREGMFVCRISGRSMEPRIADGDYAVFRSPVVGSRQGLIVLAQKRGYHDPDTGGSYTVKRYESAKTNRGDSWQHVAIRLVPENPEYQPIEVTAEEAEDLVILAEFVAVLR